MYSPEEHRLLFSGGDYMAGRKYASDYRLEEHVLPNGKVQSLPVYQGKYFAFTASGEQIRFLHRLLLICCAAVFALLLPMLLDNTRLGRTVYVILPAAFALLPLALLFAGAWRLKNSQSPFIREQRDKTDKRIRGASVALTVLLGVSCLGCVAHFIINGVAANEIFCVVCMFLALSASCVPLRYRKLADTKQVEN